MVGHKFGRLTVLSERRVTFASGRHLRSFLCQCECGTEKEVLGVHLRSGKIASCGCLLSEVTTRRFTKHGDAKAGKTAPEYRTWRAILARCHNPNNQDYPNYGGRGIAVCERWRRSYQAFLSDMGRKPSPKFSIDRYPDNDGNYEPGNCRWASDAEQRRNKSTNRIVTFNGREMTLVDACFLAGIPPKIVSARLKYGWDVTRALVTPPDPKRHHPRKPKART